jgi:hypothetical protein
VYTCAHLTLFVGPDPRDKAFAWLVSNAKGESVGLTTVPWFYSPPVSIYNGGPQSEKAFRLYAGQSQFRLTVLGTDAARLRASKELPKYFVISDFEYGDALRLLSAGSVPPAAVEQVEAFCGLLEGSARPIQTGRRLQQKSILGTVGFTQARPAPSRLDVPLPDNPHIPKARLTQGKIHPLQAVGDDILWLMQRLHR